MTLKNIHNEEYIFRVTTIQMLILMNLKDT